MSEIEACTFQLQGGYMFEKQARSSHKRIHLFCDSGTCGIFSPWTYIMRGF